MICDLLSGACNPSEIEALTRLGVRVQKLDCLHAKVWIGGDDAIVGSANASQNGLPGEDEQAANSTIEAAVLLQDPGIARELRTWFERQWCASSEIDGADLNQAQQLWKRRRRSTGRGFTATLIQTVPNPGPFDNFSDLRLIAYPDKGGDRVLKPRNSSETTPDSTTRKTNGRNSATKIPGTRVVSEQSGVGP